MKIGTLVELIPAFIIFGFFFYKCVRFKPTFSLVNPFNPDAKVFIDRDNKKRLLILLAILALLMIAPFIILLLLGGAVQIK